jgi:hypothetical protein
MKMGQTECSETFAYKIQTPGNYSEESTQRVYIYSHLQRRSNCSLYEKGNSTMEVARKPMVWWVPEPMRCVIVDSESSVMDELLTAKPIRDIQTCQCRQSQLSSSSANCGSWKVCYNCDSDRTTDGAAVRCWMCWAFKRMGRSEWRRLGTSLSVTWI